MTKIMYLYIYFFAYLFIFSTQAANAYTQSPEPVVIPPIEEALQSASAGKNFLQLNLSWLRHMEALGELEVDPKKKEQFKKIIDTTNLYIDTLQEEFPANESDRLRHSIKKWGQYHQLCQAIYPNERDAYVESVREYKAALEESQASQLNSGTSRPLEYSTKQSMEQFNNQRAKKSAAYLNVAREFNTKVQDFPELRETATAYVKAAEDYHRHVNRYDLSRSSSDKEKWKQELTRLKSELQKSHALLLNAHDQLVQSRSKSKEKQQTAVSDSTIIRELVDKSVRNVVEKNRVEQSVASEPLQSELLVHSPTNVQNTSPPLVSSATSQVSRQESTTLPAAPPIMSSTSSQALSPPLPQTSLVRSTKSPKLPTESGIIPPLPPLVLSPASSQARPPSPVHYRHVLNLLVNQIATHIPRQLRQEFGKAKKRDIKKIELLMNQQRTAFEAYQAKLEEYKKDHPAHGGIKKFDSQVIRLRKIVNSNRKLASFEDDDTANNSSPDNDSQSMLLEGMGSASKRALKVMTLSN